MATHTVIATNLHLVTMDLSDAISASNAQNGLGNLASAQQGHG